MPRPRAATLAALAACLGATPALAFECKRSDRFEFVHLSWPARRVAYGVAEQDASLGPVVRAAFDAWVAPCSDLALDFVGPLAPGGSLSEVRFVDAGWAEAGRDPAAVAVTVSTFVRGTGELRRADVEVNREGFRFGDTRGGCAPGAEVYDLLAVLTHEAGHFIGLDHTTQFVGRPGDPTMAPSVGTCEADKRSLEPDDLAGLCALYPAGRVAAPCIALPRRDGPYVSSEPLACSLPGERAGRGTAVSGLLLLLGLGGRAPRSCRKRRSGG